MQLRVCRAKKAIRNNLNRWANSDEAPGMFTPHVVGAYRKRKLKISGKEIYLRLGEMTQQNYRGKAFCTVIAVLVDINGNPIDDTMHFVPDGFLFAATCTSCRTILREQVLRRNAMLDTHNVM
jgi:hypothetical protein